MHEQNSRRALGGRRVLTLILIASAVGVAAFPVVGDAATSPVVHVPRFVAYYGDQVPLEAKSMCSTGDCVATLHWRTTGQMWQSVAMTIEVPPAEDPGGLWTYRGTIAAIDVTTAGVDYFIEVTGAAGTESTPTHHITVLAPTAVVHVPVLTAARGRPIPIEALVPCSTATCSVTLSYRVPGDGLLAEPPWTESTMTPIGEATALGDASVVQRYATEIPADAVTTRGVDYFIHAFDGHTNTFSPGTAYAGSQFVHSDGTRAHYFHVHVTEPVRLAHAPVLVAEWQEPIEITARANCASESCTGTLSYRSSAGMADTAGFLAYLDAPFTSVVMAQREVEDLGEAGSLVEFTAFVPAEVVTTEGVDYFIEVTDGGTSAYYPGSTYAAGSGSLNGMRAAWQHVEVLLRAPTRTIVHAPPPAARFRQHLPLRFVATCSADVKCDATVWFRTTPNEGDSSVVLVGEPDWSTASVTEVAARPQSTGLVAHVFEATIPAEYVDTRGVDYLLKVSDGNQNAYWPPLAADPVVVGPASVDPGTGLVAYHVHVVGPPAIVHVPPSAAVASEPVELNWVVVCSADDASDCATEAFLLDETGSTEPVPTSSSIVGANERQFVLRATATLPAVLVAGTDEYFLWASDGRTNAYSPGTTYTGAPTARDGSRSGAYAVNRYPL